MERGSEPSINTTKLPLAIYSMYSLSCSYRVQALYGISMSTQLAAVTYNLM